MNYAKHVSVKKTPQSEAIPGSSQVKNSAGGFSWQVDDWVRLDRFLVLGTEGGSYYASEKKLTKENAEAVGRCIKLDGARVVKRIVEISDEGRAPKNDPALFALAMAAKLGDEPARKAAYEALPKVARIGTHLFHFADAIQAFGGWGRATTRAFSEWYTKMPAHKLALQTVKYQARDGWSHRDILRKAHPKAEGVTNEILRWAVKGWDSVGADPHPDETLRLIWAFEVAKTLKEKKDVPRLVSLIQEHKLPHECVPNEMKGYPEVWEAMLPSMGVTAMIRNLGKMTQVGLLSGMSDATKLVVSRVTDEEVLRKGRVHPLALLVALKTYAGGHGIRGSLSWEPVAKINDALDAGFYKAFKTVEPSNKRTLLALDVSGSMGGGEIAGMPGIAPRVGAAAMALVTANVEPNWDLVVFSSAGTDFVENRGRGYAAAGTGVGRFAISPRMRLDTVIEKTTGLPFGNTDCALPMLWAEKNNEKVDTFIIYTDSETWFGDIHPKQALDRYRQKTGIPAKLVVVGMVANSFSIADPTDKGMLDVVGFDTATPVLIRDFAVE